MNIAYFKQGMFRDNKTTTLLKDSHPDWNTKNSELVWLFLHFDNLQYLDSKTIFQNAQNEFIQLFDILIDNVISGDMIP